MKTIVETMRILERGHVKALGKQKITGFNLDRRFLMGIDRCSSISYFTDL